MFEIIFVSLVLFVSGINTVSDVAKSTVPKQQFFELILDRVEIVIETPNIVEWNLRIKKINKTRSLTGSVIFHVPIGNDYRVGVKILKKQGGEYRYMPYSAPPTPYCDTIINDKYVYPDMLKQSNFPQDVAANCPVPPKNYTLYAATFNLDSIPTVMFRSGEYAGELSYYKDNIAVGTYRVYGFINNVK